MNVDGKRFFGVVSKFFSTPLPLTLITANVYGVVKCPLLFFFLLLVNTSTVLFVKESHNAEVFAERCLKMYCIWLFQSQPEVTLGLASYLH